MSSQVIEHVDSDSKMLQGIHNTVKKGGSVYISSVVKKWYGWWIYKCNGKVTCDPTHVREYSSKEDFAKLIESHGFRVTEVRETPFLPSFFTHTIRLGVKMGLLKYESVTRFASKNNRLYNFLKNLFRVPAPGYFTVEVVAKGL